MIDPNTPTPAAPIPTSPVTPASGPQAELTPAQAETMISWIKEDLAAGKITPEAATKAFGQLGATAEQLAQDSRSDEVKALDAHFPAAKPEEFLIRYGEPGREPIMTPEMKQFDTTARTWLSEAQFPRELGNSLINTVAKVAQHTRVMTPDQLESYASSEFAKLEQVFGATLDDKLRAAGRMVEELERKQPGLKNLLRSKGLGDNAMIASLLIQQAERYWARRR